MDYYESIVINYLRANRATFVNTEYCLQLNSGHNPDKTGSHWYCDAVAIDFNENGTEHRTIFLCEVSYAASLTQLIKRLKKWNENWEKIRSSLISYSHLTGIAELWEVRPWLFIPESCVTKLTKYTNQLPTTGMPKPKVTTLEMVQPWRYCSWNRVGEDDKSKTGIPRDMW